MFFSIPYLMWQLQLKKHPVSSVSAVIVHSPLVKYRICYCYIYRTVRCTVGYNYCYTNKPIFLPSSPSVFPNYTHKHSLYISLFFQHRCTISTSCMECTVHYTVQGTHRVQYRYISSATLDHLQARGGNATTGGAGEAASEAAGAAAAAGRTAQEDGGTAGASQVSGQPLTSGTLVRKNGC